ncbi:MAG TPA: EF-hand domain-containing protein [Candidatus Omnitrophota bacterium]|nr:EF-hand domain-containing protein [Candidatus Omnitrophota bacterium]
MTGSIDNLDFSRNFVSKIFSKADSNSDGQISESEFKEVLSQILDRDGETVSFSSIDTNGDGSISKDELSEFVEKNKRKMPPPPPPPPMNIGLTGNTDELFSAIDTDGDGVISKSELTAYLNQYDIAAASTGTSTANTATGADSVA